MRLASTLLWVVLAGWLSLGSCSGANFTEHSNINQEIQESLGTIARVQVQAFLQAASNLNESELSQLSQGMARTATHSFKLGGAILFKILDQQPQDRSNLQQESESNLPADPSQRMAESSQEGPELNLNAAKLLKGAVQDVTQDLLRLGLDQYNQSQLSSELMKFIPSMAGSMLKPMIHTLNPHEQGLSGARIQVPPLIWIALIAALAFVLALDLFKGRSIHHAPAPELQQLHCPWRCIYMIPTRGPDDYWIQVRAS